MADTTFKSIGDVLKLLPTSTVIVYEVLNPIVTNTGSCSVANKAVTAVLLVVFSFTCAFSAFTDSYVQGKGEKATTVDQEPLPFRFLVDLVVIDGEWFVDDFSPVTSADDEAAPELPQQGEGSTP